MSDNTTSQEGCADIYLRSDGIVECTYKAHHITLPDAQLLVRQLSERFDEARPILADITLVQGIDRDARVYFASSEENLRQTKIVAFVTNRLVSRVIGNFFLGLNKPVVPTKLFATHEEAIAWLNERRDD